MSRSVLRVDRTQQALNIAWFATLALAALVLFVTDPGGDGTQRFSGLADYPARVVQNTYRMIRVAMPFLPAGLLLSLVMPQSAIRLLALGSMVAGTGLALAANTGADAISLARDLLFAVPGLALGVWLADCSRSNTDLPPPVAAGVKRSAASSNARLASPPSVNVGESARHALGALLGVAAIILAADLPRWGVLIAVGLALYAALLWWRPPVALVVVPAALPLLDLAPWTGRFFWDEFDLLMLTTLAVGLWRGQFKAEVWQIPKLRRLLALFLLITAVSLLLGLFPLQAWDANARSAYWSHYNSLRLGKGVLWGLVFYAMYRSWPDRGWAFAVLCTGMAMGVLGVSTSALWEQVQFAGAATTADYRVTGSFSSMHTGGGHFEAYLAMALPFVWGLAFRARNRFVRALLAVIFLFGTYALLTTVARGGAVALGFALVLLIGGTWQARRRHLTARAGLVVPALLGVLALAVMIVGMSGAFWGQRIAQTAADADIRLRHWSEVLDLRDATWTTTLFGQGLGRLPASNLAHKLPDEAGSYRYGVDRGTSYLALNSAGTLYMAQRVSVRPMQPLTLRLEVRAPAGKAGLEASLCEKNLFNSRQCQWLKVDVKPDQPSWQGFTQTFSTGEVGAGNWITQRPVQLSLYNPAPGTVIEVTHVQLLDKDGRDLLTNGDFAQGGDAWFFKSGDHLFWHAKNLWVHVLFEQGWLGVLTLSLLMLLALLRLTRSVLAGDLEPTVWLAALAAMVTVGLVDSLVDAPRLAQLVYFVLLAGGAWGARPGVPRPSAGVEPRA